MDVLIELAELRAAVRAGDICSEPRTSAERHVREYGHRLAFGCCAVVSSDEAA